jgi:hypothetical protein
MLGWIPAYFSGGVFLCHLELPIPVHLRHLEDFDPRISESFGRPIKNK